MKKLLKLSLLLLLSLGFLACQKEEIQPEAAESPEVQEALFFCTVSNQAQPVNFTPGDTVRNFITVDGEKREYLIYVPSNYNSWYKQFFKYPVVYMLHGSDQYCENMADASVTSWTALAESEEFFMIYPQGWSYTLPNGQEETKWDQDGLASRIAPGQTIQDDVKFMKEIRKSLLKYLRAKCRRFYACGFSGGGYFVKSKIRNELDDKFAATTSTGSIGLRDVLTPSTGRRVPHFETCGSRDRAVIPKYYSQPYPVSMPLNCGVWSSEPFWSDVENLAVGMGFAPGAFSCLSNPASNLSMTLYGSFWAPGLAYRFRMIDGLTHRYPGTAGARDFTADYWNFMKGYTL